MVEAKIMISMGKKIRDRIVDMTLGWPEWVVVVLVAIIGMVAVIPVAALGAFVLGGGAAAMVHAVEGINAGGTYLATPWTKLTLADGLLLFLLWKMGAGVARGLMSSLRLDEEE